MPVPVEQVFRRILLEGQPGRQTQGRIEACARGTDVFQGRKIGKLRSSDVRTVCQQFSGLSHKDVETRHRQKRSGKLRCALARQPSELLVDHHQLDTQLCGEIGNIYEGGVEVLARNLYIARRNGR